MDSRRSPTRRRGSVSSVRDRLGGSPKATRSPRAAPCCAASAAAGATRSFLVWDDHRLAVLVAKVLRPDQAADPAALDDLRREAAALGGSPTRSLVRGFGRGRRRPRSRTCCSSTSRARRSMSCSTDGAARARAVPAAWRCTSPPRCTTWPREGDRAPRRQARQRRDGRAAAADRPVRRPHAREAAARCAGRSAPTATWRPSSATRRAARSARRPTCSGSPRRCTRGVTGVRPFPRARARRRRPAVASRSSSATRRRCRGACLRPCGAARTRRSARDPGDRPERRRVRGGVGAAGRRAAAAARARPPRLAAALTNVNPGWVGRLGSRPRG